MTATAMAASAIITILDTACLYDTAHAPTIRCYYIVLYYSIDKYLLLRSRYVRSHSYSAQGQCTCHNQSHEKGSFWLFYSSSTSSPLALPIQAWLKNFIFSPFFPRKGRQQKEIWQDVVCPCCKTPIFSSCKKVFQTEKFNKCKFF